MNGDEAMCFGSAFIASNSSASFKVRTVYLTQHPEHPLAIRISPVDSTKVDKQKETILSDIESDPDSMTSSFVLPINYEKTY